MGKISRGCYAIVAVLAIAIGIVDSFQSQRPASLRLDRRQEQQQDEKPKPPITAGIST
jgi:uncharacterized protein HemX